MELSVVVPTLDEAAALPAVLGDLAAQQDVALEVIVADGGSRDGTPALAHAAGARVVAAPRGRGVQLNAGAAAARARWLLFLHADSRLAHPHQLADALACLRAAAADDPAVAGHWPLRFRRTVPGHDRLFDYLESKSASNRPGTVNGDQGLLLNATLFRQLGGYDASLPYFEDQRLAARLLATGGRFVLLPGRLGTSARRFEVEGHAPRYALMALIVALDAAGLNELLAELTPLYRAQGEAAALDLRPFYAHVGARVAALPRARRRRTWAALGHLLRDNAWQLAHAFDVAVLRDGRGRALAAFDAHLAPRLGHPAAQALATTVGWAASQVFFALARLSSGPTSDVR